MTFVVGILAAAAVAAWTMAVVTVIRLSHRRSGRLSLGAMAVRGMAWFDARNFQPEAAGLVRNFRMAFVAFFVCVLGLAVAMVLRAAPA